MKQNDSINDYYYYDTPNPDFMEKNNSNQNNGEIFWQILIIIFKKILIMIKKI